MDRRLKPTHMTDKFDELEEEVILEVEGLAAKAKEGKIAQDQISDIIRVKPETINELDELEKSARQWRLDNEKKQPEQKKWSLTEKVIVGVSSLSLTLAAGIMLGSYLPLPSYSSNLNPVTESVEQVSYNAAQKEKMLEHLYDIFDLNCGNGVTIGEFITVTEKNTNVKLSEKWNVPEDMLGLEIKFKCGDNSVGIKYDRNHSQAHGYDISMSWDTANKIIENMPEGNCGLTLK